MKRIAIIGGIIFVTILTIAIMAFQQLHIQRFPEAEILPTIEFLKENPNSFPHLYFQSIDIDQSITPLSSDEVCTSIIVEESDTNFASELTHSIKVNGKKVPGQYVSYQLGNRTLDPNPSIRTRTLCLTGITGLELVDGDHLIEFIAEFASGDVEAYQIVLTIK